MKDLAVLLSLFSATCFAQPQKAEVDYPGEPIRIVVGFTPGGGPDITARVQFFLAPIANAANQVKDGRLAALGVSSAERDSLLPDVPAIADTVPGYQTSLWFGLLESAEVPRPIIARLNREIVRILSESEVKQRWTPIGIEPRPRSPEEFDRLIRDEVAAFSRIASAAHSKVD